MVVLAVTDDSDEGSGGLFSDVDSYAWYRPGLTGQLQPSGSPSYAIAVYDTGANANLLRYEDWQGSWDMATTADDYTIQGAGPDSVSAHILDSYGYFVDGLDAIDSGTVATSGMCGVGNVRALGTKSPGGILPSIIGTPLSVFYTTVIRTDQMTTVQYQGQEYTSPRLDLYTSRYAQGVPRTFDHRIRVSYRQEGGALPPLYVEDSLGLFPSTPTASDALMIDGVTVEDSSYQPRTTQGRFLFDTGAQVTVLSLDLAYDLGLDLESPEFTVPITGIGGTVQDTPGFVVDTLRLPATGLGDMELQNVPVVVLNVPSDDDPLDGIVGMNLFTDRNLVIHGGYGLSDGTFSGPFVGVTGVNPEGQATYCIAATGQWSVQETWNADVPTGQLNAYVEFDGAVELAGTAGQARSLWLGRRNVGTGTLTMDGSAELEVGSTLHLGSGARWTAQPGARVILDSGARIENESVQPASLTGTTSVSLVFRGGVGQGLMEVASAAEGGLEGNFAFASLSLGQDGWTHLLLVDEYDNQSDGPGNEILALGNLEILSESVLNLGNAGVWIAAWDPTDRTLLDLLAQKRIVSDTAVGYLALDGGVLLKDTCGGDVNLDGSVDVLDYEILSGSYGLEGGWGGGDLNYDGLVNFADYVILARSFGAGGPPPAPLPEPATWTLLLAAAGIASRGRKAKRL
jgi:hypothetical protein